jgi:c-di-GMP-binding flagellar brake protein YcgR
VQRLARKFVPPRRGKFMQRTPRQYPRFRAALPVVLKPLDLQVPLRGHTSDISWGGLYVEMTFTQPVSTRVDITLWVGETKICAKGVVVSNHPGFGNGVKFTELADGDREQLKRLLNSLGLRALCAKAP